MTVEGTYQCFEIATNLFGIFVIGVITISTTSGLIFAICDSVSKRVFHD